MINQAARNLTVAGMPQFVERTPLSSEKLRVTACEAWDLVQSATVGSLYMSRIRTEELLDRIEKGQFKTIRVSGFQSGEFYMMLVDDDGVFIHENKDGSKKTYRKVENALDWIKRKTKINKVEVDITLWKENEVTANL